MNFSHLLRTRGVLRDFVGGPAVKRAVLARNFLVECFRVPFGK